ncbi:alpha/beta hydrolase [Blastococcus sp. BMG 814]|uniref:Alpha/beta hydrolase n=1 Tax=Blastococcus carthaginiensis TaxID=3050034 RepID=A0ABT9I6K5_9ACTN|nr:alpha/beta hydrolase [Blastococcus carthaginiensis]MDP5181191.1 alpha/beta hydrolase [Blastococcus carthaginiensis]
MLLRRSLFALGLTTACMAPLGMAAAGTDPAPEAAPGPVESTSAGEEGFVEVEGARIFYQTQGEGQPILLIHGYPLNGDLFAENRKALVEAGYRVITVDLRGYGRSGALGEQPEGSIESYAGDVLAVMDELGVESAVIGGMSMGGPIVFSMYQQAPDRFEGIILIDTVAAPAPPPEAGVWRGLIEVVNEQGTEAVPPLIIDEMLTGEARLEEPELVDYVTGLMDEASKQAYIAGAEALATRPDFRPLLPEIDVPTLVMVGLQDTIYPVSISQQMAEAIPGADLEIIDDGSHAMILEEAREANEEILDWAEDQPFAPEQAAAE